MRAALTLAEEAMARDEVPVGAVLVQDNQIIGRGCNAPITSCDPSAHAEISALRDAADYLHNYRLPNTTLYVTIEPCTMCVGAIVHARVERLVFGAFEPKAGGVESQLRLFDQPFWNHRVAYQGGVLAEQASELMSRFFSLRREKKKQLKNN